MPRSTRSALDVRRTTIIDAQGERRELRDLGRHRRRTLSRQQLAAAWLEDRLPSALRGRVTIGARELGLVALLAALALCVVAGLALRSSAAAATPVQHAATPVASPTAAASPVAARPAVGGVVVVDVAGAVLHPQVLTLPAGSRVYQALKAAGGVKRGVDVSGLNLARVMVDGEQIVVGRPAVVSSPGDASTPPGTGSVSLNRATESELEELPGVGPVTAKSILAWRSEHGGFTSVDELEEVSGIGPKTFAKLKPLITL